MHQHRLTQLSGGISREENLEVLNLSNGVYEGFFTATLRVMRLNLVWYVPIFGSAILVFSGTAVINFIRDIKYLYKFWTRALLISPSAYVWFVSAWTEIFLPVRLTKIVPLIFAKDGEGESISFLRRYALSFLVLVGIIATYYVLEIIIWGSFPLFTDAEHYVRIRMIPFLPIPDRPFLK
jgi:hypothetical protein